MRYVSNWRLACRVRCALGRRLFERAQEPSRVASALREAGRSPCCAEESSSRFIVPCLPFTVHRSLFT
eukprot:4993424-Lingulodinium_polyedra.AAC.1